MQENTIVAILSIIPLALGVVFIVMRVRIAALQANAQRSFLGEDGKKLATRSTPNRILFVGVGFLVIGAAALVLALSGAQF